MSSTPRFAPLLLALALAGCTPAPVTPAASQAPAGTTPGVAALLPAWAEHVIVPGYVSLDDAAQRMDEAARALADGPDATKLETARQAWKDARAYWEASESHLLGPVKDQELDPALDTWPVDRGQLDEVLASDAALDQAFIALQPPTLKGFHVIEYVLFANEPDQLDARKLSYLTALTSEFAATTARLRAAWAPTGENFVARYNSGEAFGTAEVAFAETLFSMADICEEVAESKLEAPLAAGDPKLSESHFSQSSLEDFRHNLEGVKAMYLGKPGASLSELVAAKDGGLDARVRAAVDKAIADLTAVPAPFDTAITAHPEALRQAQASIRVVHDMLQQDVYTTLTGKIAADAT